MSEAEARLFVAAEVPERIRGAFSRMRDELARRVPAARWVRAEGMHLTFKFLGSTPRSRLTELGDAVAAAASARTPFRLTTGAVGRFGSARRPRVLWIALEGDLEACASLAASVEAALEPMGFPAEKRPFHPHLTLARFAAERPASVPEPTGPALESTLGGLSFPVDAIVLFESLASRGGARYEVRRTCPLGSGAGAGGGEGREA